MLQPDNRNRSREWMEAPTFGDTVAVFGLGAKSTLTKKTSLVREAFLAAQKDNLPITKELFQGCLVTKGVKTTPGEQRQRPERVRTERFERIDRLERADGSQLGAAGGGAAPGDDDDSDDDSDEWGEDDHPAGSQAIDEEANNNSMAGDELDFAAVAVLQWNEDEVW